MNRVTVLYLYEDKADVSEKEVAPNAQKEVRGKTE